MKKTPSCPPFSEWIGTLNGIGSRNLLLASPGGKLLSEARLMRGGDRLVHKCSWMSGIRFGFLHSTGKSKTFSHRHPSSVSPAGSEEPSWLPASPRGKPRTQKTLATTIQRTALLRGLRVARLATPTGCGGNHWLAATNMVHSLSFAFAQQLPQRGSQGHFVPQTAKKPPRGGFFTSYEMGNDYFPKASIASLKAP